MKAMAAIAFAVTVACIPLAAQAAGSAKVGNPKAGRIKANTCMGCHGIPDYATVYPSYRVPHLGGQNAKYIIDALKEYRSGKRYQATMSAQANSLTDQDIADIAAFLSHAPHHK